MFTLVIIQNFLSLYKCGCHKVCRLPGTQSQSPQRPAPSPGRSWGWAHWYGCWRWGWRWVISSSAAVVSHSQSPYVKGNVVSRKPLGFKYCFSKIKLSVVINYLGWGVGHGGVGGGRVYWFGVTFFCMAIGQFHFLMCMNLCNYSWQLTRKHQHTQSGN